MTELEGLSALRSRHQQLVEITDWICDEFSDEVGVLVEQLALDLGLDFESREGTPSSIYSPVAELSYINLDSTGGDGPSGGAVMAYSTETMVAFNSFRTHVEDKLSAFLRSKGISEAELRELLLSCDRHEELGRESGCDINVALLITTLTQFDNFVDLVRQEHRSLRALAAQRHRAVERSMPVDDGEEMEEVRKPLWLDEAE